MNLYIILITGSLLIHSSQQYKKMTIEDPNLCSPITTKKVYLDKKDNSGLIVAQNRLNDHSTTWKFDMWCKFRVVAIGHHEGVIAVIQQLTLRRNSSTEECIDYVQFIKTDGSASAKFCGRFNAALKMDHNFITDPPEGVAHGNSFVDPKGELSVMIHIAKQPLNYEEEMDLVIVFTSYKHCSEVLKRNESYRPCSDSSREYCIYPGFFSDFYINCPLADCTDEAGCSNLVFDGDDSIDSKDRTSVGNKVLIGSISTLFIVLLLFIVCLWICKNRKIFCWTDNFANSSSITPPQETRVIELSEPSAPPLRRVESLGGVAPSATTAEEPEEEDKDPPPSYDSLFPRDASSIPRNLDNFLKGSAHEWLYGRNTFTTSTKEMPTSRY